MTRSQLPSSIGKSAVEGFGGAGEDRKRENGGGKREQNYRRR